MADVPVVATQTLAQDAHIQHSPSPSDVAPTIAAERKHHQPPIHDESDLETASISSSTLLEEDNRRHHHNHAHLLRGRKIAHHSLPPLPDLRFEQSYLASIAPAKGDWWKIFVITVRDQVVVPLVQGTLFSLALLGWKAWNRRARFVGRGLGARIRRWWWGVNKWSLPEK